MNEYAAGHAAVTRTDTGEPLVGRDAEWARLLRAVEPGSGEPVLVLLGEPGTGKSALLDAAARRAGADGAYVLRAEGSESEASLAFSTLHQVVRGMRALPAGAEGWPELPERQRAALRDAFGGEAGPGPEADAGTGVAASASAGAGSARAPDLMLVGLAVLGLLSAWGERGRVLVVLDDAQWCDRASLDALSFAARRLAGEPVTMLVGARVGDPLAGFERNVPTLTLGPLDAASANRLLDLGPEHPTGRTRSRILDQAGGNPLALTELSRATADPAPAAPHAAAPHLPGGPLQPGPLPLTARLEGLFAARLDSLPAPTSRALLLLAAMDSADSGLAGPVGRAVPDAGDAVWAEAERAGLVRRYGRAIRFRHPLARSAVYHAASFDARGEAHLALAALSRDAPDRRAWHLAAACHGPDAEVCAELERTADRARRRGGHAAAAKALERAAELAPAREDAARLLVEAAGAAVPTGDLAWVEELAAAARARTDDPSLLAAATVRTGRLATLTARHSAVFSRLTYAAEELTPSRPDTALEVLTSAAVVRFYAGEETQRRRVQDLLARLPADAARAWPYTWARTVTDPYEDRAAGVAALPRLAAEAERRPEQLTALAIMAWLLDETPLAVRAFDEAFDRWEVRGPLPEGLGGAAAWAYLEQGRWEEARHSCARIGAVGSALGLDHAVACGAATEATVLALQGDTEAARSRVAEALALVDPLESRSVAVYARRALGTAATAEGAYEDAYAHFRAAFTPQGAPVHYHASYPALADLAAAAARCGHREEAAALVERAARALAGNASPRLRALIERARGLLADPEGPDNPDAAEPHFRAALADPVLEHWPFERAQAQLDLAEWLRRRRRIAEARHPLTASMETFRRLGAHPWLTRARAESRAAGLDTTDPAPEALAELSPQQRHIVTLAARGLTNREIAEKLYLSPRTVASHLYRTFPKLGITARTQLRDLLN